MTEPDTAAEPPELRPDSPPGQHAGWLARLAAERHIVTAESCTAGRVATRLAAEAGASDFFLGGVVAYHARTKRAVLGVSAESVYSEDAAGEMAVGACALTGAHAAVATTGVAGPEPIEGVAPGTVYIGVHVGDVTVAHTYCFDGTEDEICERASEQAIADLAAALRGDHPLD